MGDKIRLLICQTCGSIEELPFFEGPPEHDDWLKERIIPHRTASGEPHIGSLATVEAKAWGNPSYREEITKKISKEFTLPGKGAGLGQTFYDLKSTYLEDAMACWRSFGRTTDPSHCDYRKDNKRLYPDTKADRKDLGLSPKDRPNTFLCDFCPVQSIVQQKKRDEAGLYK
jgi:hypothetical protein